VPRPHTAMRKVRDVLRLSLGEQLSQRRVAAASGLPRTTVKDYLRRAEAAGLKWPLPADMDDAALEAQLFVSSASPSQCRPLPEWDKVHKELRRPHVTLMLVWLEYKETHPDGYAYSQFAELYRRWRRQTDAVMHHEHKAGEKLFVDFPGETVAIYDERTAEVAMRAELFVAVLGASSYVYAEAVPSQKLLHWVAAHVHTFEHLGGCPAIVVPDNLRSGVTKAHRYEPDINATFAEMAAHYGVAVMPARAYKPRDKAKAEGGVLLVERWIIARLRNRRFCSLAELNEAIADLLAWLNDRPFKKLEGSRRLLFEELDRPALRPLPPDRYEFATWRDARLGLDYHVEVRSERHYYSAPYRLIGEALRVRLSAGTVEVFYKGRRVASHVRAYKPGWSTDPAHMPESHRRHAEWTPSRILAWAAKTGPATAALVEEMMARRPHPEQGFRSCIGIIALSDRYGADRLEAACARAGHAGSYSYRSVQSILRNNLDTKALPASEPGRAGPTHENLRGPGYYQ